MKTFWARWVTSESRHGTFHCRLERQFGAMCARISPWAAFAPVGSAKLTRSDLGIFSKAGMFWVARKALGLENPLRQKMDMHAAIYSNSNFLVV